MPKFVIEREIPRVGAQTPDELHTGAARSNEVLRMLGPDIRWLHSYVTADKIYCVYVAPDADILLEHARCLGVPADRIERVVAVQDPSSGE